MHTDPFLNQIECFIYAFYIKFVVGRRICALFSGQGTIYPIARHHHRLSFYVSRHGFLTSPLRVRSGTGEALSKKQDICYALEAPIFLTER